MLNRRDFIRRVVGGGVGIALAPSVLLPGSTTGTYRFSLSGYYPMFYADESLAYLRRTLANSHRIYRRYDDHYAVGDTIRNRIPEWFT